MSASPPTADISLVALAYVMGQELPFAWQKVGREISVLGELAP
jgi:hypothetical protein